MPRITGIDVDYLKCTVCGESWSGMVNQMCPVCFRMANIESELPKRYAKASFDNYVAHNDATRKMRDVAKQFVTSERGLYLAGTVGTGKTHLSIAVFRELVMTQRKQSFIRMTTIPDLMSMIRATYDDKSVLKDMDVVKEFAGIEYLILDDFGAEKSSAFTVEMLYTIIDKRYIDNKNKMFVTSNLSIKEIAERTSDRIASRIVEMCDVYWFDSDDYRLRESK